MTARVVLVHGAWHGAWCFTRVVAGLAAHGVAAVAVDLPGHGDDRGAVTDLHGDAARLGEVLDSLEGPVVLLGHSYGGAVITEAGVHPAVEHLVFVAGFPLDLDETCQSAAAEEAAAARLDHAGRPDLGDALLATANGSTTVRAEAARLLFYNDCDDATAAWAVQRLEPQLMVSLSQSPVRAGWRERRSTYLVCSDDLVVHPGLQRLLAARCTDALEWPTGHTPFLSRPDLVTDLLVRSAAGLDIARVDPPVE